MQRAVVFLGGTRDAATSMQRALPGSVAALALSGVHVPTSGRRDGGARGFSHQRLADGTADDWEGLRNEVRAAEDETTFLVIPGLLQTGVPDARRRGIISQLSTVAEDVVAVSVVGDQLTLINDSYRTQVATWRVSGRLERLAPRFLDTESFAHETLLRPWYDDKSIRYVAVHLDDYGAGHPVAVVLRAAGVELSHEPSPATTAPPPKLGPTGIEANRLLSTYLRAVVPGFTPADEQVAAASRVGLARAEKLGWCQDEFWGWTRGAGNRALARFDASNQRFSRAVWGEDWDLEGLLDRPCNQVDFLDLEAQVVEQIQHFVVGMADKVSRERDSQL